jgi:peptide-methionine (R)-S-oxide reductase
MINNNMKKIVILFISLAFLSCNGIAQKNDSTESVTYKVTKTDAEWKAQLTPLQYTVMRKEGTERQFSSEFNKNKRKGIYVCAACETPLFKSEHKYDSGSGWPSFDREIKGNVAFSTDRKIGYLRVEEHCASCGGHLGHVFDDGPRNTTGKRHCVNGVALKFIESNE